MKRTLPTLCLLMLAFASSQAQQPVIRCATDEILQQNAARIPGYADAVQHAFEVAKARAEASEARKFGDAGDTIYRIPVVFHVVYNTTDQNLNDSLMYNQIEVLNQDYRRMNTDTGNTRTEFKPVAADAGIEFFLATEDPDGNPTTGITRTSTGVTSYSAFPLFGGTPIDSVKKTAADGIDAWDTDKYLNIWICNIEDFIGQVLGFAYPPDDAPNFPADSLFPSSVDSTLHGIVIHYAVFGRNNPLAVGDFAMANKGRTVVHEVGHYLGLAHIWGNVTFFDPDGCALDDGVDDTPESADNSQQAGCDITKNTCTDGTPDLPDMFENYMDYSREECQNVFTHGQVGVMRGTLATSRKELPLIFVVPTGIQNTVQQIAMNVYPNPAQDKLNISFPGHETIGEIIISDLIGKAWLTVASPAKNAILDLNALPSGIYTVTAKSDDGMGVRKVVVE